MPGLANMNRFGRFVEKRHEAILISYLKCCPSLYHVCFDPIGTHPKIRAVIGFFLGLTLGIFFYVTIILDLAFDPYTTLGLGAIVIVMLSAGCASSIQVRCVCVLTIPAFFGRSGRSMLKALVLGFVIAGPIFNLTYNGKEVVRTFACTAQLTYNLTKTRFDLMFKPVQQAMLGMKDNINEVKDTLSSVRDLIGPIVEEIEGEEEMKRLKEENDYLDELQGDTKRSDEIERKHEKELENAKSQGDIYEAKYREKIEVRCEEQLSRGSERCREGFADAYNKCYDTVTWLAAWLLCWPMKLTFVCNIVQALGGSSICNPEGKVDVGIGEGYASLKDTRDSLSSGFKDARLQYKLKNAPLILDLRDAGDTAKAVLHDFNIRRHFFDTVMTLLKRCLAFVFLKIILSAQDYHDRYLTDIEHDNHYITSYFRKIDARRRYRGSAVILPLKKVELQKFVDPYRLKQGKIEKKNLIGQTVKLILEMVTATTFVLLDRLFFETLDLIRRHGHMEFTQSGHHDLNVDVKGTGVIASLIRSVVKGFNVKKRIKMVVTNAACLPRPSELSNYILLKIYGTYTAIWIMLFVAAYTQRLRRLICSFFYRKREKRRVLYLYNETLRRRLGYFRFMKVKVRALVRASLLERDMDPWVALRLRSPTWCGWLKFFAFARLKCLICGEPEGRKETFRRCETPGCEFIHCWECWRDMGEVCLACMPGETDDEEEEDYDTQIE
ncbi:DC-STAMP domain-containing protein 1-like [Fopius arisanus]|uniref:DC-STAMP domain-containing protein 1-like n=1 Tax=Fopius arisanus TaxID=64838 RepID=A0A9R1U5J7_9HYME|nr:PREDICTED: DC-STAMP domain-containing protein 1-like [Fopius arisanus]